VQGAKYREMLRFLNWLHPPFRDGSAIAASRQSSDDVIILTYPITQRRLAFSAEKCRRFL
jgi:hypothetical protein